ncbi:hypothetical protein CAPTEDRAFT_199953 [Capitella teleta]|uniref:Uncharacterized protein n=1 Tax=Capitella teleta TaxID=283909 RepID=R7TUS9_CAPTE|nr:hypothetical protein CAPTEDRAFT_199953 [Capitella teleta]|eukprot:ELT97297.1 hypothetical protein CAPTEDRAFT_199953 [Capitella teleta]
MLHNLLPLLTLLSKSFQRTAVNLADIHYQVTKTLDALRRLEGGMGSNMADLTNHLASLTLDGINHKASEEEIPALFNTFTAKHGDFRVCVPNASPPNTEISVFCTFCYIRVL